MSDQQFDLEGIQTAIQASGAGWYAGTTALTRLPEEERHLHLGYVPGPGEPSLEEREQLARAKYESSKAARPPSAERAPASYDLTNVGGRNFITPVQDQGNCGSCVAFGTIAAVEGTRRVGSDDANLAIDLSEAHLFYCHARSQGRNCLNGWWPSAALECFKDPGVTEEACYPYTAGDQECAVCGDWQARVVKISRWHEIDSASEMKTWISTKGPLVTTFIVYSDFYAYRGGVYRHVSGDRVAGHCVCIVGYDDAQGAWLCKNSWGKDWGERYGYFRIAYGDSGIDATMWAVEVEAPTPGWQYDKLITGLWGTNEERNAWVHVEGLGWRKIAPDQNVFPHLLALLTTARAANRPVNFREENNVIKEVYVF
jgi:C1A family cysteine protease